MDENVQKKLLRTNRIVRIQKLKDSIHKSGYQDHAIDRIAGAMSNIIYDHTRENIRV